jgi:ubiquitin-conjugating enzyme E2 O
LTRLTLIKTRSDQDIRVGDKVFLKDATDGPITVHGQEGEPAGTVIVKALTVQETCTSVNVLWQDGMQETLRSTELIPYMNPDEYDCW